MSRRRRRGWRATKKAAEAADTEAAVDYFRRVRHHPLSPDMGDLATELEERRNVEDRKTATQQAWFRAALESMQPDAARKHPHE